jgi:acyl transferase domain-containing protein
MIQPEVWRGLSALRFISPDGECHSFDSRANGYSRGEGMGVVIVKPLADALRDNDVIRAVIRVYFCLLSISRLQTLTQQFSI